MRLRLCACMWRTEISRKGVLLFCFWLGFFVFEEEGVGGEVLGFGVGEGCVEGSGGELFPGAEEAGF